MKCFKHDSTEAVAICARCGRALCSSCVPSPAPARIVCSDDCASALARDEKTLQLLLRKSVQSAKASAFYCYLSGGLSAAGAVAAWYMLPSPFLIFFTAACAVVLTLSGFWYQLGSKKLSSD